MAEKNEVLSQFQLGRLVQSVENLEELLGNYREDIKKQEKIIDSLEKKRIADIASAEARGQDAAVERKKSKRRQNIFNFVLTIGLFIVAITTLVINFFILKGGN